MKLFPRVRIILAYRDAGYWCGVLAHYDKRFSFNGPVPVFLTEEAQTFDTVVARFDGSNCWFEEIDYGANPETPVILREELTNIRDTCEIDARPGFTVQEKEAYGIAFIKELANRVDRKELEMKEALRRGGAVLRSYIERDNTFTVEYTVEVDGRTYEQRSVIDSESFRIISPGICLTDERTGEDTGRKQDLQSLVGVIREGIRTGGIYRD